MRGFLRRDLDLMIPNLKIYGGIFAIMLVVSFFTSLGLDFFAIYACIFTFSGMLGLFNYDEANHWQAYAAAAPNGRRSQVEARYALAFLFSGGVTLVLLIADLVSPDGRGIMGMPFFYGGLGLVYAAVAMPLCYRFGVNRGRVFLLVIVALSAVLGAVGSIAGMAGGGEADFPVWLGLLLLGAGILANLISRGISVRIMARKEL
ncbi:ABC-2 transporter permease [Candidatus Pseudoscillospira sp. SGI.172]|uniref:ABC-2 transporter permease n=1 Tax=Candidatus Pseudoscillospira sp. SGI.172 TaxID=3420582 RepID=UPI002A7933F5|nr:ABC-2 transporter permease [Pseudoflavonifractor sp.]MDY3018432.1 ABC-2 transporter permease [Oscillospiraceae bacterium]